MGWGERVARSHARRLEKVGWVGRYRMMRGDGSLLAPTRRGVLVAGLPVTAPAEPHPAMWAHDCACAWTAAWLSVRGRDWLGPREILIDPEWKRKVKWRTGHGLRRATHRPDLGVEIPAGRVALEVELQRKANYRLEGILDMYNDWVTFDELAGVIYVCRDENLAERIAAFAEHVGLPKRSLRTLLLDHIREEASQVQLPLWRSGGARSATASSG
jgi:hypothetical protein